MPLNILITGANSGFGLLTAETFAKAGHTVHASLRNPAKAQSLEALKARGLPVEVLALDVTDQASIDAAVAAASAKAPLDVLVNNAGYELSGPVEHLTDAALARQFDTNVMGVVRTMRAVIPAMRARRSGTIVNLSSVAGLLAGPFSGAYSASKHAVEALSEAAWYELRPFGVRVVLIEPGAFQTNFGENIVTEAAFDAASPYRAVAERFSTALQATRAGPPQDPQEVADLVLAAVVSDDPKLRHLAGNDARMFIGLRQSTSFEGFTRTMLTQLGLSDVIPVPAEG